jgi:hypothetical protein
MKILYNPGDFSCALWHIANGHKKVLNYCGHEVIWWNPQEVSTFDIFNQIEPDLFLGTTYNLDRATIKNIVKRPNLRVVLRASDWGMISDEVDLNYYKILVANKEEIQLVKELKESTGKPDFIHNHYHDRWIHKTHSHWEKNLGIRTVGIMLGANLFDYYGGKYSEQFASDLCIISSYHPSKAINIDKFILPLCYPVGKYNIKIFSSWPWPVSQYCGSIPLEFNKTVLASAKICLNIGEPFSTDLNFDVIERPFYTLSNKCFCISEYVQSMQEDVFDEGEIPAGKTPQEYWDLIDYYLKNPLERDLKAKFGHKKVMAKHTYFHRISQLFTELNLPEETNKVMVKYEEWKSQNVQSN